MQLQTSFIVSRGASWTALMILFESQQSFVPLLSFSLWSKQESHFSSFSHGILVEAFWLAEASWKLLLLTWDISLSKMCVKELRLWSLFSFKFYAQCFLGAMNTPKAVSLDASAIDRCGVQINLWTEWATCRWSSLICWAHNTETTSWILISKRNKSLHKIWPKECTVYIATKDYSFVKPYWCRRCIKILSLTQGGPCII